MYRDKYRLPSGVIPDILQLFIYDNDHILLLFIYDNDHIFAVVYYDDDTVGSLQA